MFADLAGLTYLVDNYSYTFSSWMIRTYLLCVSEVVNATDGVITAFEGDGVMVVFTGESKEEKAVECALRVDWTIKNLLQGVLNKKFPDIDYKISHVVGIDSSTLVPLKTSVWEHYDIFWMGRAANYAANLTRVNYKNYSVLITCTVYAKLNNKSVDWDQIPFAENLDQVKLEDVKVFGTFSTS